jgi:hypothetical protein
MVNHLLSTYVSGVEPTSKPDNIPANLKYSIRIFSHTYLYITVTVQKKHIGMQSSIDNLTLIYEYFFKLVLWGMELNCVHSALRPQIGLFCQPRVIMMTEKLVEWWFAGEIEVLGENRSQCRCVHHKSHMPARTRTRAVAVGNQWLTAWATARPTYEYNWVGISPSVYRRATGWTTDESEFESR